MRMCIVHVITRVYAICVRNARAFLRVSRVAACVHVLRVLIRVFTRNLFCFSHLIGVCV